MVVYLETVIIDNFCIDSILLYLTNKITKTPNSKVCIILASMFGVGFAIISPFIKIDGLLLFIIKMVFGFVLVLLSIPSLYKILLRYFVFLLLTFLFGGALMSILYFMQNEFYNSFSIFYNTKIPIGAILALSFLLFFGMLKLINKLFFLKTMDKYFVNTCLCIRGKIVNLRGYIDSANFLHNKMGKPVVIINENFLSKWLTTSERIDLIMKNFNKLDLKNPHVINLQTITKKNYLIVFDADYIQVGNRKYEVAVGIQMNNNIWNKKFDILLNEKMLEV